MLSIAQGLYRKNLKGVFRNGMLAILYASGNEHNSPFFIPSIGAIWFLWAMFGALVIFQTIANMKLRHLVAVILFYCGILSSKYVWLPLSVQAAMTAVLFMDIGYSFKGRIIGGGYNSFFIYLCLCLDFIFSGKVLMVCGEFPLPILNILGAVGGSCVIFCIAKYVKKTCSIKGFFSFCGKNSLVFLCIHIIELDFFPWGKIKILIKSILFADVLCIFCIYVMKICCCIIGTIMLRQIILRINGSYKRSVCSNKD